MKGRPLKLTKRAALAAPALTLATMFAMAAPASAADGSAQAQLAPVVLSGVQGSGTAMVTVSGTKITFSLAANGLLADSPHAAHIHFGAAARHQCPIASDDKNGDTGAINTTDGAPAYGGIVVSLTKTGDTSPASGLAIDRFDTAAGGNLKYERGSVEVSQDVANAIVAGQSVVVIHGVDRNKDGKYSGDTKSDLDATLPTEATDPALCGVLAASQMSAMPAGGVQTGSGTTTGVENVPLIAAGGLALLAGAGLVARRRRATADS